MLSLAEPPKSCRHHDTLSSNHLSVEGGGGTEVGALGERSKESHSASLSTFLSPSDIFFFSKLVSGKS